jgi:hypothetical protein
MKNLLIYINPLKQFDPENAKLIEIQIINSLDFWKQDDIILITNFPYEYKGIKATVVDGGYNKIDNRGTKITAIVHLFDIGFIDPNTLYWAHDLDAFQLYPITESELELEMFDAGFADYGRKPNWQLGSFFFKKNSEDIFRSIAALIKPGLNKQRRKQNDETALMTLTEDNVNGINARIKRMNITYNFGLRKIGLCYEKAIKPLRVLHFHPTSDKMNTLKKAMHGYNDLRKPLMTERLIQLFNRYGYK